MRKKHATETARKMVEERKDYFLECDPIKNPL